MKIDLLKAIKLILSYTIPYLKELIKSKVVPTLKRKAYEKVDVKIDELIEDLAQNAAKIEEMQDSDKYSAYLEGTRLGVATLKAIAEKLNKAAIEIERVI